MAKQVKKLEADVVIAGSGPSGAMLARDLTKKGKKVIVLERGPWLKNFGSLIFYARAVEKQGLMKTIENDGSKVLQGNAIGGGSLTYMGSAAQPDLEMWKKYGIDLSKEAEEVRKDCRVNRIPESLQAPGSKRMMMAAQELGYPWHMLEKFFDPTKCKLGCSRCAFGCGKRSKWTGEEFIAEAQQHGAVIMPNVTVRDAIVESGVARGFRARGKNGREYEVYGKVSVTSAGGMGSSRILMRSGIPEAGSSFLADPCIMVSSHVKEGKGETGAVTMDVGYQDKEHGVLFTSALGPQTLYLLMAFTTTDKLKRIRKILQYGKAMQIMAKTNDDMNGRVFLKDGKVSKKYTREDLIKLDYGRAVAEKILIKAGCDPNDMLVFGPVLGHPGGAVPVGKLLDSDLQTQIKNLYCCDTAVIPEHLGIPPVYTLLTLSKRLAKHLDAKLSKK